MATSIITNTRTLTECEAVIEKSLLDTGEALTEIRDNRLYRDAGYSDFDIYCRERWGWSANYVHKQIAAAPVVRALQECTIVQSDNATITKESQARELVALFNEEGIEAVAEVVASVAATDKVTAANLAAAVQARKGGAHTFISSSASNEWFTPAQYIEAARAVLGVIDLDPASNSVAQQTVQAKRYYTIDDDGLSQPWAGRVWMNPPWGSLAKEFAVRLLAEFEAGNVTAAITLLNAHSTDTPYMQALLRNGPACFTDHRIDYIAGGGQDASSSTHGSVFVALGCDANEFSRVFAPFGVVVVSYGGV